MAKKKKKKAPTTKKASTKKVSARSQFTADEFVAVGQALRETGDVDRLMELARRIDELLNT